jgi:hypothetical protein
MEDYQDGKIYKIKSPHTTKFYIGATIQTLKDRFKTHKYKLNCASKILIGLGDAYIELMENYPCNSKEELEAREEILIREHRENLVNIHINGRTKAEWRADNPEKNKVYNKRDYDNPKRKEYKQKWLEENKEKMKEYHRERYRRLKNLDESKFRK